MPGGNQMLLTVIPVLQLFSKRSRGLKVNCRSVILSRLTSLFLHHREDRFFCPTSSLLTTAAVSGCTCSCRPPGLRASLPGWRGRTAKTAPQSVTAEFSDLWTHEIEVWENRRAGVERGPSNLPLTSKSSQLSSSKRLLEARFHGRLLVAGGC